MAEEDVPSVTAKRAKKRKKKEQKDEQITEEKKPKNDCNTSCSWDEDADKLLINFVEENYTRPNRPKLILPKHIQWQLVARKVSAERNLNINKYEARTRWDELAKDVRRFRTVPEITEDIKRNLEFHFNTMPKKPMSAYQHFWLSKKDSIKKKYPEMALPELSKRLGKKWRELPTDKKVKYEKRAKEKMDEYAVELDNWKRENPAALEELEEGKIKSKNDVANSKKISPFEIFCEKKIGDMKEKHPDLDEVGVKAKLEKRWEKLKDHKKEKFIQEANEVNATKKGTEKKGKKASGKKRSHQPLNPYTLFFKDERVRLLKESPGLSFGEIASMVAKEWKILDPEKVEQYKQKASELKQIHNNEKIKDDTKKNTPNES